VAASLALPWAAAAPASAAGDGSTTILVLDVSGSMNDPAQIPPGFPQAARLQADEDALGRLIEQAHPGQKVPLSVIAGGLMGLPELIRLRGDLDTYLKQQGIDPATLSKLAALKTATAELLTALQFERDHAGADNRVGVVTFSSDATVVAQPTAQIAGLNAGVQALQTDGSTNIGGGLQSAMDLLKGEPNPSIILMTDGWNNTGMTNDEVLSGPARAAAASRIPICGIGLGATPADVDQRLLLDIAGRTGGGYHFVGAGAPLGGDLLACHHSLAGLSLGDVRGVVHQGQVAASPGFAVPAGHHRLTVTLSWPGSQLDARLTDPAGRVVGARYAGASIVRGPGIVVMTIANPAPGQWGLSVVGVQTATAGDQYVASASTDGATATPHRDVLVGSGAAPLDQVEQELRLARTISAVVAAALVVLWLLSLIGRMLFGRRGRRTPPPAVTGVPAYGPTAGQYPPQPGYAPRPAQPGYPPAAPQAGFPPAAAPQPGAAPPPPGGWVTAPGGIQAGPVGTPSPPSGYAVPAGQPAFAPVPYTPPAQRSGGRGCLGCLLWLAFFVDLLVLGGSAGALYLWATPLLTMPQ
jgi:VWA domain-containing protein